METRLILKGSINSLLALNVPYILVWKLCISLLLSLLELRSAQRKPSELTFMAKKRMICLLHTPPHRRTKLRLNVILIIWNCTILVPLCKRKKEALKKLEAFQIHFLHQHLETSWCCHPWHIYCRAAECLLGTGQWWQEFNNIVCVTQLPDYCGSMQHKGSQISSNIYLHV